MSQIPYSRSITLMCGSVLLFAVNVLLLRWLTLQSPQIDGWAATFYRGCWRVRLFPRGLWNLWAYRRLYCPFLYLACRHFEI